MEPTQFWLAIDIGSSSIRCSVYDDNRKKVVTASYARRSVEPSSGRILLEAEDHDGLSLLDAVDRVVEKALLKIRKEFQDFKIVCIGFACFVMNLVGIGHDQQPSGPTLSYACTSSTVTHEVFKIKRELGSESVVALYQATGAPLHSAYAIPQLRVLYQAKDQTLVTQWQTLSNLCRSRWSGTSLATLSMSYSEASWTGLLNFRTCRYEERALNLLSDECKAALPALSDFDENTIILSKSSPLGVKWPEVVGARLFLGVGDGACANIGSKCTVPHRIACTVGTSAAVRVCLPLPILPDAAEKRLSVLSGLFCYRVDRSHILLGGALTDGGSVIEWIRQLLNLQSDEDFRSCMTEVERLVRSDKSTVITVPFLSGERSTGFRSSATGAIVGLTRETTPAILVKSCMEGVTLRLTLLMQLIQKSVASIPPFGRTRPFEVVASGRALEVNVVWRQMIADSCGLEVFLDSDTIEGTSRGVMVLMTMSGGFMKEEDVQFDVKATPKEAYREYWQALLPAQEAVIDVITPLPPWLAIENNSKTAPSF